MGEVIPVSTTQLSHTEVLTQITNSYPWNQIELKVWLQCTAEVLKGEVSQHFNENQTPAT
jgi:hypothetical protein